MAFFLEFEHTLRGRTPEEAFGTIQSWLHDEKAQVKEALPPSRLVAAHGRALQPLGWRKDARKTIAFELERSGPDIILKVRITPAALNASDVRMRADEARANWAELLAELWVRFGESEAVAEAARSLPVDWNTSLARGKVMVLAGVFLLGVGAALFLVFLAQSPASFGTGLMATGVLCLVYGGTTVRSARRHLAAR